MNTFIVALLFNLQLQVGYQITDHEIQFEFPSMNPNLTVFVSGNFNGWVKDEDSWKMTYNDKFKAYQLTKSLGDIKKKNQSFYEFTFRVDGELIDADPTSPNVINCPGYGHRYIVKGMR
ncbi:MAG: hypothetical protein RJQ09_05795 [Cyclobacteriaceae bacterium]